MTGRQRSQRERDGVTLIDAAANIGRGVVYQSHADAPIEQGTIEFVNDSYVFVRYQADMQAKATRAEDLRWMTT